MNMGVIARKNIQGNLQRYLAYFFSCVFAVSVFFIFASFIYHPDVDEENMYGASLVINGLTAAQIVIIVFSLFFIAYSNSAFLQARKKEFGLLSLLGMTNRQLQRMIYLEQTIVSFISIGCGILLGLLFSKLFFMVMNTILKASTPIGFAVVPKAIVLTVIGFIIVFQFLTIFSLVRLKSKEIIELLKASKQPKGFPTYSKWLSLLSFVCIGACYYLAASANLIDMIARVLPILLLVLIGTYFFFTQGSIALYRRLYQHKPSFYSGTTMITRSNVLFRLKDHARMLFLTSIITAVILTASGTVYMFYGDLKKQGVDNMPQAIGWVEHDASTFNVLTKDEVEKALKDADSKITYTIDETGIPVSYMITNLSGDQVKTDALMIPESLYNKIAEIKNIEKVNVAVNNAFINYPYKSIDYDYFEVGEKAPITMSTGEKLTFTMDKQLDNGILTPVGVATHLFVVDDKTYEKHAESVPLSKQARVVGYELEDWENEVEVSKKIGSMVDNRHEYSYQVRAPGYQIMKQATGLTLFIGLFISVLFFAVQGSMMYLRLFTEIEDTRTQLFALRRIGMSHKEMRSIIGNQISFLFFVPFVVGTIHAAFAYIALSNMLYSSLVVPSLLVIGIYFVFQVVYYVITRAIYERNVLRGMF